MRSYELMTIHRPEMAETDVRARVTEIESALRTRGAEIDDTEFWGKRRFAYEISHVREGYYSVVSFRSEPGLITDLDRALSLSDQVLRHKFIRTDGKPVGAIRTVPPEPDLDRPGRSGRPVSRPPAPPASGEPGGDTVAQEDGAAEDGAATAAEGAAAAAEDGAEDV